MNVYSRAPRVRLILNGKTIGQPKKVRLTADRAIINVDRNDLTYIAVKIVDDMGRVVPDAEIPIEFEIEEAGVLAGAGSANPSYIASFKQPRARSFRGRCLVILQPEGKPGEIRLTAESLNLVSAAIIIQTVRKGH